MMDKFTNTQVFTFNSAEYSVLAVPSGSSVVVSVRGGDSWINDNTITGPSVNKIYVKGLKVKVTLTGDSYSMSGYVLSEDE
ncbi:MAG: hypothetical protein K0U08_03325 [Proteobacteria bacterium]|nr:hypothetical protein [Pseudomonadota bacterium]